MSELQLGALQAVRQSPKSWLLCQVVLFEAIWLTSVLGQNSFLWICLGLLGVHFALSPKRRQDLQVLPLALVGLLADGLLIATGVFDFPELPIWLGVLWLGFVLVLGHSLIWLRRLPWLVVSLLGAVAGSTSYLAGWRFGAVELPYGLWPSTAALVLCWALLLPLLVLLDSKIRS